MDKAEQSFTVEFDGHDLDTIIYYFKGYTGVDMNSIPPKYNDYIIPTKDIMTSQAKVVIKYCGVDIAATNDKGIVLENGEIFTGDLIKKAYEGYSRLYLFVTSVINIDEILEAHPDVMETFFLEYWAVSMLNASRVKFLTSMNEKLKAENCKLTSVWSPGQSKFELKNQLALFHTLKPESIGVTLDKHTRMIPLKTVSGTVGVMPADKEETMISCDFCEHNATCPGYTGRLIKNQREHQRLI